MFLESFKFIMIQKPTTFRVLSLLKNYFNNIYIDIIRGKKSREGYFNISLIRNNIKEN